MQKTKSPFAATPSRPTQWKSVNTRIYDPPQVHEEWLRKAREKIEPTIGVVSKSQTGEVVVLGASDDLDDVNTLMDRFKRICTHGAFLTLEDAQEPTRNVFREIRSRSWGF